MTHDNSAVGTFFTELLESDVGGLGGLHTFAGVDASRDPTITAICEGLSKEGRCLYSGDALDEYGDAAPWIFELDDSLTLAEYLIDEHLGARDFVLFRSSMNFNEFHLKMRKFTKVRTTRGDTLLWKLFNPDELGTLLPFFTLEQRHHYFQGLHAIFMEISAGRKTGFGRMRLRDDGTLLTTGLVPDMDIDGKWERFDGQIADANIALGGKIKIDMAGAAVRPLLTLTNAQMEAPLLFNRPKLVEDTISTLEEDFGEAMHILPPRLLALHINYGIDLAVGYGFNDVTAIQTFIDLMMRIAPGWHRQKDINKVLKRNDLLPSQKLEMATSKEYDRAWLEATTFDDADEWIAPELRGS